jgi:hypothetical protein
LPFLRCGPVFFSTVLALKKFFFRKFDRNDVFSNLHVFSAHLATAEYLNALFPAVDAMQMTQSSAQAQQMLGRYLPAGSPFRFPSPLPLPAENHPLLAAFNGLNPRPQSVILISYENISAVLSRPKGALKTMPVESKRSDQVKKPSASSAYIQQLNPVLADLPEQETSA